MRSIDLFECVDSLRNLLSAWLPNESVLEHVIRHLPALGDSLGLVEGPVNTEIDSALAIFFFSLRERGETARQERAHIAIVAGRGSVELVRDERERNRIGTVEFSQDLKERAPEAGVPGRVCRKGVCKVWPVDVVASVDELPQAAPRFPCGYDTRTFIKVGLRPN